MLIIKLKGSEERHKEGFKKPIKYRDIGENNINAKYRKLQKIADVGRLQMRLICT